MDGHGISRREGLSEKYFLRIVHSVLEVLLSEKGFTTNSEGVFNVDSYSDTDGSGVRAECFYDEDSREGFLKIGHYIDHVTGKEYKDLELRFQVVDVNMAGLKGLLRR